MVVTQLPAQRAALAEERGDWWRSAACLEADPDLFFPVAAHGPGAGETARAKAVCAACLVRRQCLQYALATHQLHGVWGGTAEDERKLDVRPEPEPGRGKHCDRGDLKLPARAEPGGNGTRGRGGRIRSV